MEQDLIPLGERARMARSFWPIDVIKPLLPGLFWFILFPVCLFSYRATVPLAGVYCLILLWQHGWRAGFGAIAARFIPLPWLVWLALVLMVSSLLWTHDRMTAVKVLGSEVLIVSIIAIGLVALAGLKDDLIPARLVAASLILTSLMLMVELQTGMMIHAHLGLLQKAARLNQSVMIVTLASFPVLFMLRHDRWVALLTALVVVTMVMMSTKTAAKLGLVVAALGYGVYRLAPVFSQWALWGVTLLGSLTSPWWGQAVSDVVIRLEAAGWVKASATDRLPILKSFGAAVLQSPWIGYGFNGSFSMLADPRFPDSQGPLHYGFMQGHPHNLFLQVFVETGLAGLAVMMGLLWLLLKQIARLQCDLQSAAGAFLVFNLAVLAVSHGAWQAWWWAADLLAVVLFVTQARMVRRRGSER